ncbi:MAG: hypothetical protein B6I26_05690 [Desulfobacteraceae bacterium 4572_130]|nr:MAG: hypothetical protein B6I26_05690 [Desulfobacteraceae bacterium 4572_130]
MSNNYGLYIHVPFCLSKCFYCDFYSISDLSLKSDFIAALLNEIKIRADLNKKIDTIYLGGGTPSILDPFEIEQILLNIYKSFQIVKHPEITLEVNPNTLKNNYFKQIKGLGINRLNIGVQSFQDKKLLFLNRSHSSNKAKKTILQARNADFDNLGLDIIYGLPKESFETLLYDLNKALEFEVDHLSCYTLTYESGTKIYNKFKGKNPLNDNFISCLFELTSKHLKKKGYIHYEISNFATTLKHKSKHNQKYWDMLPYLGFGPCAHSFDNNIRFWNYRDIKKYILSLRKNILPVSQKEILTKKQKMLEIIMLGLRTLKGVDIIKFENIAKQKFAKIFKNILKDINANSWGTIKNNKLVLNLNGMVYLNSITSCFAEKILK